MIPFRLNLFGWGSYSVEQRAELNEFIDDQSKRIVVSKLKGLIYKSDKATTEYMAIKYPKTITLVGDENVS